MSADLTAELAAEPWLEPYVADGDTSSANARLRRRTAQEDYLRRSGDVPRRGHRGDVIFATSTAQPDDEPSDDGAADEEP